MNKILNKILLATWSAASRNFRLRRGNFFASCLAVLCLLASATAHAAVSERTADFLNILGIDGHIDNWVTEYLDATAVVTDAKYIGVRHWRDGLGAQGAEQIASLQGLVNAGISLVGLPLQYQSITVADHIAKAKVWAALGAKALFALEGPNEPGLFPITYNGVSTGPAGNPTTFLPVAQFQRDYYTAVKADSVLHAVPLWSPTLGGDEPNNVGVQYLTIPSPLPSGVLKPASTVYSDAANLHVYPMWDGSAQTVDSAGDRIKLNLNHNYVRTYAQGYAGYTQSEADALPKVITEFGYPATGGTPGGHTCDEYTQGKNILTGFLNAWSEGYTLVVIYDLYDVWGDGFGIFYGRGNPKPAATYLHNLTSILADTGSAASSFAPGSLSYAITGMPSDGQTRLFQKSNG